MRSTALRLLLPALFVGTDISAVWLGQSEVERRENVAHAVQRVKKQLESDDSCAARGISESDLELARNAYKDLDGTHAAALLECARHEHCSRVGAVVTGETRPTQPQLGDDGPLLKRIAERALLLEDFRRSRSNLPCSDHEVADSVWKAFVEASTRSTEAWSQVATTSDVARGLRDALAGGKTPLSEEAAAALMTRSEGLAKERRLKAKESAELEDVVALCGLVEKLGQKLGIDCRVARTQHDQLTKREKALEAYRRREAGR